MHRLPRVTEVDEGRFLDMRRTDASINPDNPSLLIDVQWYVNP
jgi:hypothetical protein